MAPNKFFQHLRWTLKPSPSLFCCLVCVRQLKSRGGLTKHLNANHPGFDGDIDQGTPFTDNEGSGHSVYTPDTPSHSQPQSSPSQAAPSPNLSSNHQKSTKKHCWFRFSFHGGFSISFESVDLQHPTNQEDYHVHMDKDADMSSGSSCLSSITSAFPTSPVAPISLEEDYHMHADDDMDPPPPAFPPFPFVPSSLEHALSEDFWYVDMDCSYAAESLSNASGSSVRN